MEGKKKNTGRNGVLGGWKERDRQGRDEKVSVKAGRGESGEGGQRRKQGEAVKGGRRQAGTVHPDAGTNMTATIKAKFYPRVFKNQKIIL